MRKTFGIERRSFLPISIPEVEFMAVANSAVITQIHFILPSQPKNLSVLHYPILILAWSALVIFYGEIGLSPPLRNP
jgi:hypothetical protein